MQIQLNSYPAQLQLTDINGKLILSEILNSELNSVNLSMLSQGMYIYKITSDTQVATGKLIKE
jgi:hypothetical protein